MEFVDIISTMKEGTIEVGLAPKLDVINGGVKNVCIFITGISCFFTIGFF